MDQSTNPGVTSEEVVVPATGDADAVAVEETKATEATEVAAEPTEGAEEAKEETSPEAETEAPAKEESEA